MRRIAVVTTFSLEGYQQYAERMVSTWVKHWPVDVDLFVYPDEKVALPKRAVPIYDTITAKEVFIRRYQGKPRFRGKVEGGGYNYRFDAVKFCHKPFALWHWARVYGAGYHGLIWLDADTVTHSPVDMPAVERMAPAEYDIQFLGRSYKYSECGYLYFNLRSIPAVRLLENWVGLYTSMEFAQQPEWHDSYLYDVARNRLAPHLNSNDLTGHIPRSQGAGHPLINSFMGQWLDHLKGESRKVTGKPRKGDLFADHGSQYWKDHSHAKQPTKPKRTKA